MSLLRYDPFDFYSMDYPLIDTEDFWPMNVYDAFSPFAFPRNISRPRSFRQPSQRRLYTQDVVSDKDKYQVALKIPDFKANEVSVKVVDNNLVVDAEHEEKPDEHGRVYRRISRRFRLPRNADVDKFESTLTNDGLLTITAPKKPFETQNARTIEVKPVGSLQQGESRTQQQQPGQVQKGSAAAEQQESKMDVDEGKSGGNIKIPVTHESSKK